MAAYSNAIIQGSALNTAMGVNRLANLESGAQYGVMSHLQFLDAATPLTLPAVIPVVLSAPTLFHSVDGATNMLKAFVERHVHSIDGIDLTLNLETEEGAPMRDGQRPSVPTVTKRADVNPSLTCRELPGNSAWNLIAWWIKQICDPDTGVSASSSMVTTTSGTILPRLMSTMAMDVLFIQPSSDMRPENMIEAVIITGMIPKSTGPLGMQKKMGEAQVPERTFEFTGIIQANERTRQVGRDMLQLLQIHSANSANAVPVASQIDSYLVNQGLQQELAYMTQNHTPTT